MSLVDKSELQKLLRAIAAFEYGSPYVAVYMDEKPTLYRSSTVGFIQSRQLTPSGNVTYANLAQLIERLRVLPETRIELSIDASGILTITSTDNTWSNELRVHSVKASQAGLKPHNIGEIKARLSPTIFQGFTAKPFTLASHPYMVSGKIMLPTFDGIVMWQGGSGLETLTIQPRDQFLKFLSPSIQEIYLTANGYWGAISDELLTFVGSHNGNDLLFKLYNVPAEQQAIYPAERLAYALNASSMLSKGIVEITAGEIRAKDMYGHLSRFAAGGEGDVKFTIHSKTAKLIVDVLEQAKDEQAVLSKVEVGTHATMRIERGPWTVSFKVF